MNFIKLNKMTKQAAMLLGMLVLLLIAGCTTDEVSFPKEVATPTGCLKSQGHYYDPKLEQCVTPSNQHEALILDSYRYVNQLAEEGKFDEAEYRINLKKYSTIAEAEVLWDELKKQGAKMYIVAGTMPDGSEKSMDYSRTSLIWSGMGLPMGWQKFANPDSKLEQGAIKDMLLETVESLQDKAFYESLHKAVADNDDFRIGTMSIFANPSVPKDFWDQHLDQIEAIQPIITTLDKAQSGLGPIKPLREGE